jgi:hypothetical protein
VPPAAADRFPAAWSAAFELACTRIGRITHDKTGVTAVDAEGRETPLARDGFAHFREDRDDHA